MKKIEVVAAVIRRGDKIFAVQRGYGKFKDWWEFPGGKIEAGETAENALKREIMEELDTEILVGEMIRTVEWDYPDFHVTLHCFWCTPVSGKLLLKEHEASKWLGFGELRSVQWLPADMDVINDIEKELDCGLVLETERLFLRRWKDSDAQILFKYASSQEVGPPAGWKPHESVEESLEIIRTVFAAPETYALVLKETGEPVGSIGLMFNDSVHSAEMSDSDAEIGYWIGVPYWGHGLVPEAVMCLLKRGFEALGLEAVWCGWYEGNTKSQRVAEKCGFRFHHRVEGGISPLGDVRTECFARITRSEWLAR